jgi:hypothetical protein
MSTIPDSFVVVVVVVSLIYIYLMTHFPATETYTFTSNMFILSFYSD